MSLGKLSRYEIYDIIEKGERSNNLETTEKNLIVSQPEMETEKEKIYYQNSKLKDEVKKANINKLKRVLFI